MTSISGDDGQGAPFPAQTQELVNAEILQLKQEIRKRDEELRKRDEEIREHGRELLERDAMILSERKEHLALNGGQCRNVFGICLLGSGLCAIVIACLAAAIGAQEQRVLPDCTDNLSVNCTTPKALLGFELATNLAPAMVMVGYDALLATRCCFSFNPLWSAGIKLVISLMLVFIALGIVLGAPSLTSRTIGAPLIAAMISVGLQQLMEVYTATIEICTAVDPWKGFDIDHCPKRDLLGLLCRMKHSGRRCHYWFGVLINISALFILTVGAICIPAVAGKDTDVATIFIGIAVACLILGTILLFYQIRVLWRSVPPPKQSPSTSLETFGESRDEGAGLNDSTISAG